MCRRLHISAAGSEGNTRLQNIKLEYTKSKITTIDGIKINLENGWLHVRSSNTEPIVRIIAEAKTKKEAKELTKMAINIIKIKK